MLATEMGGVINITLLQNCVYKNSFRHTTGPYVNIISGQRKYNNKECEIWPNVIQYIKNIWITFYPPPPTNTFDLLGIHKRKALWLWPLKFYNTSCLLGLHPLQINYLGTRGKLLIFGSQWYCKLSVFFFFSCFN